MRVTNTLRLLSILTHVVSPGVPGLIHGSTPLDPAFKRVIIFIFVGSRGGHNRVRIVELLREEPMNPNRISERLELDYKTVQHHLKLLDENGMIVSSSPKGTYGAVYFLSPYAEKHLEAMRQMWARFGKS